MNKSGVNRKLQQHLSEDVTPPSVVEQRRLGPKKLADGIPFDGSHFHQRQSLLAAVLGKGPIDVATIRVCSNRPDIVGGDHG